MALILQPLIVSKCSLEKHSFLVLVGVGGHGQCAILESDESVRLRRTFRCRLAHPEGTHSVQCHLDCRTSPMETYKE